MKTLHFLLALLLSTPLYSQQIFVVSNQKIDEIDPDLFDDYTIDEDEDILIFHGNSIGNLSYKDVENKVDKLRDVFDRVYLIPGEEDWETMQSERLKDVGDDLDDEFKGDVIVPENSCGGVEIKDISETLALVFIDSEWYFRNWEDDKESNKDCEAKSRPQFWSQIDDELGKLKSKQIILFTRHPLYRYDELGGYFSLSDNVFPFRKFHPSLYVPLPFVGTLFNDTYAYFNNRDFSISPYYQEYSNNLFNIVNNLPKICIITGDNVDNYYENIDDIITVNVNTKKNRNDFHQRESEYVSNEKHFLYLDASGADLVNAKFQSLKGEEHQFTLLQGHPYRDTIVAPKVKIDPELVVTRPVLVDSEKVVMNKFFLGGLNSELYNYEFSMTQLDVSNMKGGMKPVRLGGGQQTQSLRLQDSTDQVYVARSLKKRAEKALPIGFNYQPLRQVMKHFFLGAHPLGYSVVPVLDSAIQVYHTSPRTYFLPKQEGLGMYNSQIGDEIVLFRERADEAWPDKDSYGNSENIVSSSSMIEELVKGKGDVNREMYLRCRLLDYLAGDWDRHADQWRWAEGNGDEKNFYSPIARDRDQVFSNFDGLIINIGRSSNLMLQQLREYDDHLSASDIRWMHWKSSFLDKLILQNMNIEDWERETEMVKNSLTDEVIEEAFGKLPPSFDSNTKKIKANFKQRLEEVEQTSEIFRRMLFKIGVARGTEDDDKISIIYKEKEIGVIVISEKEDTIFNQVFPDSITSRLWIYGMDGDDEIQFMGSKNHTNIEVKIIGGFGDDIYNIPNKYNKSQVIDDQEDIKDLNISILKTDNKAIHDLSRNDFIPDLHYFFPRLDYNTDDGFKLGGGITYFKRKFKTQIRQTISADYLTRRQSPQINYNYEALNTLTMNRKFIVGRYNGPRRRMNYFGPNGSTWNGDANFYEVNTSELELEFGNRHHINRVSSFASSIYTWIPDIDYNENTTYLTTLLEGDNILFERQYFIGTRQSLRLKNFDSLIKPTKGARMELIADVRYNIERRKPTILFGFEYDYYKDILRNGSLIFSTKIRAGHIIGDYLLYEGYQVGGRDILRGYRIGRFTGRTMLGQNNNLHIRLIKEMFKNFLPSNAGVSLAFDHGRTWSSDDINERWNISYGFGAFISPLDMAVISAGYHISREDRQLRVQLGWQF